MIIPHGIQEEDHEGSLCVAPSNELTERSKTIALWQAQGATDASIQNHLGASPEELSLLRDNPTFNIYTDELRKELTINSTYSAEERIQRLTGATVQKVAEKMSNGSDDRVQLDAAKTLLDRQLPKLTRNENTQKFVFKFEGEHMKAIGDVFTQVTGLSQKQLQEMPIDAQMKVLEEKVG